LLASKTGASFIEIPVIAFRPLIESAPSEIFVVIVKLELKLLVGVNLTPASNALTSAIAPLAVHTPVPVLYVEVTAFDVPVLNAPAEGLESVSVAVRVALSISAATISIKLSDVSSVYVSAVLILVAVGASFTATIVKPIVSVAVENALVPPEIEASAVPPSVPLV
jgi:hypothetical protein